MRLVLATLLFVAGCHGAATAPPPAGALTLQLSLMAPASTGDVAIASAAMHLLSLVAVSDRSSNDPRATANDVDLGLGDMASLTLATAPPGLYSAVDARLGGSIDNGLDVQAVWHTARVHATLATAPFDVGCAQPVRLDPGAPAALELRADPSGWFAGLDLGNAVADVDDNGIVISEDDNRPLAEQLLANVLASFTLSCGAP